MEKLTFGKLVYLEQDKSDRGKYGRLLRYIYVNDLDVNSYMVRNGYARVHDKYSYDIKKYDELKEVEEIAIKKRLGVWSCD